MTNRYDPADFESVQEFVQNMERLKALSDIKGADKYEHLREHLNDIQDIVEEKQKDTD